MVYYAPMDMEEKKLLLEEEKDSHRRYSLLLWWVEHRLKLRHVGVGLFVAVNAFLLLYVGWMIVDIYLVNYQSDQLAVAEMVAYGQEDLNAYTISQAAGELILEDPRVLSLGDNQYDLYASVINPNSDWWAEFTYEFVDSAGVSHQGESFILPGEENRLLFLRSLPWIQSEQLQ